MEVRAPLEITASLLAGYTFPDGSTLEVDGNGGIRVTETDGTILYDSCDGNGEDHDRIRNPFGWNDYNEIMENACGFIGHDAEVFDRFATDESIQSAIDDDYLIFPVAVGRWAGRNIDELSMLGCDCDPEDWDEDQ